MTTTSQTPQAPTPPTPRRVVVVGGGASGVLTAVNLLSCADADLRVTLYAGTGTLGEGVAYSTTDVRHLLNVRARHMSAFPDVPSDLIEWAQGTGRVCEPTAFLPRRDYAFYLRDRLAAVADSRLEVVAARVEDIAPTADGFEVLAGSAAPVTADGVVLAYGNQAPRPLTVGGEELPPNAPWHVPNPWDLRWTERLADDAVVVLVGTGLTAVDTAITVLEDHPGRRVVMTSRHGLLPRAHVEQQSTAWVSTVPGGQLSADRLVAFFREQVAAAAEQGVGWRAVVDGLRAPTQSIWMRLPLEERRRFLAEHAREWEVRRHRMAPQVAARLAQYRRDGRLGVVAGGIDAVSSDAGRCTVRLAGGESVAASAVVNCTGPETDVTRSTDPLLRALHDRRLVAPDALRLGLACTPEGEVVDRAGRVVPRLFAVGPPRKGTLYESTAVPEIRSQAAQVAHRLGHRESVPELGNPRAVR